MPVRARANGGCHHAHGHMRVRLASRRGRAAEWDSVPVEGGVEEFEHARDRVNRRGKAVLLHALEQRQRSLESVTARSRIHEQIERERIGQLATP